MIKVRLVNRRSEIARRPVGNNGAVIANSQYNLHRTNALISTHKGPLPQKGRHDAMSRYYLHLLFGAQRESIDPPPFLVARRVQGNKEIISLS